MPMDQQALAQAQAQAARLGLSLDAFIRMAQGKGAIQAPAQMPQQKPFAQGAGPGGQYGGDQGQVQQPWQQYAPKTSGQQPGIGAQITPAGSNEADPSMAGQEPPDTSIWGRLKTSIGLDPSNPGVPFGQRIINASTILGALADPYGRSLAPTLAAVGDRTAQAQDTAEQKAAYYAEQDKLKVMSERIYQNLKDTNPVVAEAIRGNPKLAEDYMKGQLDLDKVRQQEEIRTAGAKEVQTQQDAAAMDRLEYSTEHDPKIVQLKQEKEIWDQFVDQSDLKDSSTVDTYKRWTEDDTLTAQEAKRLADANMRGGLTAVAEEYAKVIDDRDNKAKTTAATKAAALSGIKLKDGQYIVNEDEVLASNGKVKPIVDWAEGTPESDAKKAKKISDWRTDAVDYLATTRAIDAIDLQLDPETGVMTGAGTSAYAKMLPETNARELNNALVSLNAGNAFQKLAEIRAANATGAGVGNVTEGEYPILTAAEGEKFDIYQEPKLLRQRLVQHKNIQTAFMAPSPSNPKISALQQLVDDLRASPTPEHKKEFDHAFGSGYSDLVLNKPGDIPQ